MCWNRLVQKLIFLEKKVFYDLYYGATVNQMKDYGQWRSNQVADSYVRRSDKRRMAMSQSMAMESVLHSDGGEMSLDIGGDEQDVKHKENVIAMDKESMNGAKKKDKKRKIAIKKRIRKRRKGMDGVIINLYVGDYNDGDVEESD
eukprot:429904_1